MFGASDSTDTLWTQFNFYMDVSGLPTDTLSPWCLGGTTSGDTMFVRSVVVTLER